MPLYLYQAAYTPESLATQMQNPADRLKIVGDQLKPSGVHILAGGYSLGEFDITLIMDAPNDAAMAAVSIAIGSGGAVQNARTTKLLSGAEYVKALKKAAAVGYKPAK